MSVGLGLPIAIMLVEQAVQHHSLLSLTSECCAHQRQLITLIEGPDKTFQLLTILVVDDWLLGRNWASKK